MTHFWFKYVICNPDILCISDFSWEKHNLSKYQDYQSRMAQISQGSQESGEPGSQGIKIEARENVEN